MSDKKIAAMTPLQAKALLYDLRNIARDGLNSDSNDEEREALAEIGTMLGLESDWDDERDVEVYR